MFEVHAQVLFTTASLEIQFARIIRRREWGGRLGGRERRREGGREGGSEGGGEGMVSPDDASCAAEE